MNNSYGNTTLIVTVVVVVILLFAAGAYLYLQPDRTPRQDNGIAAELRDSNDESEIQVGKKASIDGMVESDASLTPTPEPELKIPAAASFPEAISKYNAGFYMDAITMFQEVLEKNPELALECNLYIGMSYYKHASAAYAKWNYRSPIPQTIDHNYNQAIEHLQRVINLDRTHKEALLYLSKAKAEQGKDLYGAIDALYNYVKIDPTNIDALSSLAMVQEKALDYDGSIESYQKIIELVGSYNNETKSSFYKIMALALSRDCDFLTGSEKQECINRRKNSKRYFETSSILPGSSDYYFLPGRIDHANKDWDSAIINFEKTIESYPGHEEGFRYLIDAYKEQGRYPDVAIEFFTKLADEKQDTAFPMYRKALIYADTGDKAKARSDMEEVLNKFPNFAPAKAWLGKN